MPQFDHLKQLVEAVRTATFWERLFGWSRIRQLLIHAAGDLSANETMIREQEKKIQHLQTDLQWQKQNGQTLSARKDELLADSTHWKTAFQDQQRQFEQLKQQYLLLQAAEQAKKSEHQRAMDTLTQIETRIREERKLEQEQKNHVELERLRRLKETWAEHEQQVRSAIKTICQRHTINYIETAPFRGTPDNTLSVCEEFIVLDAKSPAGDELKNFPAYIKDQAEKAQKYARQASVKPEIFFVVPSNTLTVMGSFVYRFADYTVYIISIEALEPVIVNLKKIEEYEFAKELTPEDRNTICSLLGRFAHLSKRRIQVDSFFARQFIQLAYKAEADLPQDILDSVMEYEKSEKLNPPQEKRNKTIPLPEIEKDLRSINQEADSRGIVMNEEQLSARLDGLPLYKNDGE